MVTLVTTFDKVDIVNLLENHAMCFLFYHLLFRDRDIQARRFNGLQQQN